MAVRFGVFVPQGWRLHLVEIDDPLEQCEAMTAVAKVVDDDPAWDWMHVGLRSHDEVPLAWGRHDAG